MAVINMNNYEVLEKILEEVLDPSSRSMRILREKIMTSSLSAVFSNVPGNKCVSKNVEASVAPAKAKAHRAPIKAAPIESRCEALVLKLEMNADGELVPARCKRSMEKDCKFCKQHGAVDGKKNEGDSAFYGKDIIHEFKWQHLGTVHEPSYIFTKFRDNLLKSYANSKKKESESESDDVAETKPAKGKRVAKADKPKRATANGYIFYKSQHYQELKAALLAKNPEMKGKELATTITKLAAEQWNALSVEEQASYKSQAKAAKDGSSVTDSQPCCDDHNHEHQSVDEEAETHNEDELEIPDVEEDESTLVYNEKYQVWVDTDNNLCYSEKNTAAAPVGQLQRGNFLKFPGK
jgi:hypothetical protein